MPRHIKATEPERTALAPYNFVPLPNCVFTVEEGFDVDGQKIKPWVQHDRFVSGAHNGWIELSITALTPLFIRGPIIRREDGGWDTRDSRLRPDPYCTPDGRPAIPGSSLRGMVRTLVEILSFSKIQPISKAKPFFRTVGKDRIGDAYRQRMRIGDGPRAGILRRNGDEWLIEPCEMLRVERDVLRDELREATHDDGNTPRWSVQHKPCWVEAKDGRVIRIKFGEPSNGTWQRGTLVLTGNVPKKTREFVFLTSMSGEDPIHVPQDLWQRFHDEDQLTQWQKNAFPRDQPLGGSRRADGYLRDEEPVFFLLDQAAKKDDNPDGLVFFGRAGMFRLPYQRSPRDLIPDGLRQKELDLAEAMFGRVAADGAIKGRVFFEDAVATDGGYERFEEMIVPRILSSPKVTTFQHYLTQDGTRDARQLTTYLEGDYTTIRGHKLYWHRWDQVQGLALVKEEGAQQEELLQALQDPAREDKQHTIIRPVRTGETFKGRVRFENLTDIELGALLEALHLPDGCHHRIGMGKPLGLGSIAIEAKLRLVDRNARYSSWQESGVRDDETGDRFRLALRDVIVHHAKNSGETIIQGQTGLRQVARLDALYVMQEWTSRPQPGATAYMGLDRFRHRPVLPTPHFVAGQSEPAWLSDPPHPASSASSSSQPGANPVGGRPAPLLRPRGDPKGTLKQPVRDAARAPQTNLPRAKDRVEAELLSDKTKKGGWLAKHVATGLSGPIQNSADVPAEMKPGDKINLIVAAVGAKGRGLDFRYPTAGNGGKTAPKKKQPSSASKPPSGRRS